MRKGQRTWRRLRAAPGGPNGKKMMRILLPLLDVLVLVACLLLMTVRPAHAYLDPGTGSYALQIGLAGLFGALFALKSFWRRLAQTVREFVSARRGGGSEVHP